MIKGIALLGQPGSGKSSVGKAISELTGWIVLSFADPLKEDLSNFLSDTNDWITQAEYLSMMYDPSTKDQYRPMLQAYGAFRRAEDPYYWVGRMRNVLDRDASLTFSPSRFVVDDCRYANEAQMLREHDFAFVHLLPGPTTRPLEGVLALHESEKEWQTLPFGLELPFKEGVDKQAKTILGFFGVPFAVV